MAKGHTNAEPTYRASVFKQVDSPVAWQQAMAQLPYAHALQSWAWGEFKGRWGWEAKPLLLTVAGNSWSPAAAALVLKRSLPRLPFCVLYVPKGPALDYRDADLRGRVLGQLEELARREKAIFIKIDPEVVRSWGLEPERVSPLGTQVANDLKARGWLPSAEQIQFRNTAELPLELTEEQLLAAMKQKTRYNIRLAEKKGVTVRVGSPDDFPAIYEMYRETAARDGFAIRPEAYYMDGWRTLYDAGMSRPLVAEVEGQPVAAVVLVRFAGKVIYMYGASTSRERERMPNYLLQWEAIRWAKEHGATVYDFWGAPDEFVETDRLWGVWRFKAGFNAEVVRTIGAWDFPARPLWYRLYTDMMPRYLARLRSRNETAAGALPG